MSEDEYRDRIGQLERRSAVLERRRLEEVDRVVRLEREGAERRIIAGHRRQAARYEEMVADTDGETARLKETLDNGVVPWVGGAPALPKLPALPAAALAADRPQLEPKVQTPRPVTPAAQRLARARARRTRAPRLTVLATASGRAGRAALAREVHDLEDWLEAVGHADSVEIAAVHAHRFADLEPAFLHRRPAVVHIVGRPRKAAALYGPLEAARASLKVLFLSADRSLEDAGHLAETVPVAIGSPRGLDDDVKCAFAAILYAGLAHGLSAADAMDRAQAALVAAKMTMGEGPRMFARLASDPSQVHVVARRHRAPDPPPAPAPADDDAELRAA